MVRLPLSFHSFVLVRFRSSSKCSFHHPFHSTIQRLRCEEEEEEEEEEEGILTHRSEIHTCTNWTYTRPLMYGDVRARGLPLRMAPHRHKQQSSLPLSDLQSHRNNPLVLWRELQHSLSSWPTPEKERIQSLSRGLGPDSVLCVEMSPTSSWYCFTSHTSSGSFPTRKVTFHGPRTSLRCQGSARLGLHLCLPC